MPWLKAGGTSSCLPDRPALTCFGTVPTDLPCSARGARPFREGGRSHLLVLSASPMPRGDEARGR